MKKIYLLIYLALIVTRSHAQSIVSVNPFTIPSAGTCTLTIVGHNTHFLSHSVFYVRLLQPYNNYGSYFYSSSQTTISDDTLTAVFNISTPLYGGFYAIEISASGIYINNLPEAVYMTGTDPYRINSITPNAAIANHIITTTITGAQMQFVTATAYQRVSNVYLESEIDNSTINSNTINYTDSNNIDVDFNFPYNATNGTYKLNVNFYNGENTNRDRFFTVVGGIPKRIVSVTPPEALAGDSIDLNVAITGRNLLTNPCTDIIFTSELAYYSFNVSGNNLQTLDSNHIRIKNLLPIFITEGDYTITLNGYPSISKHFAFRIIPPNIRGIVYTDVDSNGVQNMGEYGLAGKKIMLLPDSIFSITDNGGRYAFHVDPGIYTVVYISDTICALSSTPATYNVTVVDTIYSGMNFGVTCPIGEGHVFYMPHGQLRCNVTGYTYWRIQNPTYGTQHGRITFIHSNNLPVIYTQITPDSIHGDSIFWNYTLLPHQNMSCDIHFQDPPGATGVWFKCNDEIFNTAYTDTYITVSVCSCDPNDKSVWPQEDSLEATTLNSQQLTYNINFQNTGTDTAFLVVIADTLSPFLDMNTFEIVGASNNVITNIDNATRIIKFTFENIMLPDSNVDEPGSHGFVRYKIMPLQGIPDSSIVSNTAYIYFDFNPAVITNTATSHLVYVQPPVSNFTTVNTTICQLECINFTSISAYANSWQWSFPGGIPSSSTDENPQGVCFLNTGSFDVTLITTNGFGSDTLYLPNYLTVNVLPPPPVIYISNDTLYCVIDPLYTAYQWYDTTGIIPGATNSFYVPTTSGLYGLSVYNQQGCEAASALPIILKLEEPQINDYALFPNPASGQLHIRSALKGNTSIDITNALGKKVYSAEQNFNNNSTIDVDVRNFSPGIYFVKFQNQDRTIQKRFVKY